MVEWSTGVCFTRRCNFDRHWSTDWSFVRHVMFIYSWSESAGFGWSLHDQFVFPPCDYWPFVGEHYSGRHLQSCEILHLLARNNSPSQGDTHILHWLLSVNSSWSSFAIKYVINYEYRMWQVPYRSVFMPQKNKFWKNTMTLSSIFITSSELEYLIFERCHLISLMLLILLTNRTTHILLTPARMNKSDKRTNILPA